MIPSLLSVAAVLTALAFLVGYLLGRANVIGRLIDAKDPEGWQWAHYLRADLRTKPEAMTRG